MAKKPKVERFSKWPSRMIKNLPDVTRDQSIFVPKAKVTFKLVDPEKKP